MIPVKVTDRAQRIQRSGVHTRHSEVWEAKSVDGKWIFVREESSGTPWVVTNTDVKGWFGMFGSLSKARAGAESQLALDLAKGIMCLFGVDRPRRSRVHV